MACFLEWEAGCGLLLTSIMVLLLVQGRFTCRANFVSDIHLNYWGGGPFPLMAPH